MRGMQNPLAYLLLLYFWEAPDLQAVLIEFLKFNLHPLCVLPETNPDSQTEQYFAVQHQLLHNKSTQGLSWPVLTIQRGPVRSFPCFHYSAFLRTIFQFILLSGEKCTCIQGLGSWCKEQQTWGGAWQSCLMCAFSRMWHDTRMLNTEHYFSEKACS